MDTDDDVYQVLYKIGLNEEEIKDIVKINKNLSKVLDVDVIHVIKFLQNYGLKENEIAEISKHNPWILTESFERIRILEKAYKLIEITNFAELLKKQPIAMSINPMHLRNLIKNLIKQRKTKEEIKETILQNLDKYLSL